METRYYKTRGELKREVKDIFRGHWFDAIKLNFVAVIVGILIGLSVVATIQVASLGNFLHGDAAFNLNSFSLSNVSQIVPGSDRSNSGWDVLATIIQDLVLAGVAFTSLNWLRTKQPPKSSLRGAFAAFTRKYFFGTLAVLILTWLFRLLWTLLFIIPGIIKSYAYSQARFVFKDLVDSGQEHISYLDCITKSRTLMAGNKFRFFMLQLSFIGWHLLCILSCGIGYLWLIPYRNATYAAFYRDLVD